jgi:alpha-tubulin suppressor-like RCC1 family protein
MSRFSGRRACRIAFPVVALAVAVSACRQQTEIVLVIDTDLAVPVDMDRIDISIIGSEMQSDAGAQPTVSIDLTAANAPAFPMTLGLTPASGAGPVTVSVAGFSLGSRVIQQEADTNFVEGSTRMLRMLLLVSCVGKSCSAGETCTQAGCGPTTMAGDSLPIWPGGPPGRLPPATTTPIGGRTVWANGWHSCGVEGETLYCWGQNYDGEIGDKSQINAKKRRLIMQAPAVIGLGAHVTCSCDKQGQAWCWGRNYEGEIGLGTNAPPAVTTPTMVPGLTDCVQIAGGEYHTCAVHGDGTVSCWGGDGSGQVGQPAGSAPVADTPEGNMAIIATPTTVAGLTDVVEVKAGDFHTCARLKNMTVSCWGSNQMGQLGDGTTTDRSTPAMVGGLGGDVVEISAGRIFTCARHASGRVSCWGSNNNGQLGNGGTSNSNVPVDAMVTDATQLATGFQHTCALRPGGVVSCWGRNDSGQLGNGTTMSSTTPVDVSLPQPATSIAAGSVHTCARYASGLACWGENIVNQLGDNTSITPRPLPVTVAGF